MGTWGQPGLSWAHRRVPEKQPPQRADWGRAARVHSQRRDDGAGDGNCEFFRRVCVSILFTGLPHLEIILLELPPPFFETVLLLLCAQKNSGSFFFFSPGASSAKSHNAGRFCSYFVLAVLKPKMNLNGVWRWLVSQCPWKRKQLEKKKKLFNFPFFFSQSASAVKIKKSQVTTTVISVVSLLSAALSVPVLLPTVLHAVSAAGSHRAGRRRRPPARWRALRRPHWPQHLPRAWVHHRLHGQTGRTHVPSQMVTLPLPSSSFSFSPIRPRVVSSTSYIKWTFHPKHLTKHSPDEWAILESISDRSECSVQFLKRNQSLRGCQVGSRWKYCDDTHNVSGGSEGAFVRFEKMTPGLSLRESLSLRKQTAGVRRCGYLPRMWHRGIARLYLQHEVTQQTAALANQIPEHTHSWQMT